MGSSAPFDCGKGLVFNIQRFSIHDGPGIRTTVFMKGCPLSCPWCSNPESQDFRPNLMARDMQCRRCGSCLEACPQGAISIAADGTRQIDHRRCNQCLLCAEACPYQSLQVCGNFMGIEEILEEVLKDRAFYKHSGGGVTVSGGEPLAQADFVKRLLEACRREALHTTIDTTGYAPGDVVEDVLSLADLVLFDIKHLDPERHSQTVGKANKLILENLKRASRITRVWLRIPLIAGFNDSEEHIEAVASLGVDLGVEKISLLPYHEGGRSKSEQLGRKYRYSEGAAPSPQKVNSLKAIVEAQGLSASVGH